MPEGGNDEPQENKKPALVDPESDLKETGSKLNENEEK